MKRVFSGIQPSGTPHIGNYLGAIKNWAAIQEEYDCIYCVVDLHAITVYQKPDILRQKTIDAIKIILAAGIDPEKSIVFVQSHIKEHSELAWILNTITPIGELERMTQFKDKAKNQKAGVSAGLLDYPVLMAADILLYNTDAVPVGEDQRQHVELSRVIARKFNNLYGETFKEPAELIRKEGARIMSLTDPTKKMSKSDEDKFGCIDLTDSPDLIREKIKKAVTDSGKEIISRPDKPAVSNLLTIYSLFSNQPIKEIETKYENKTYVEFKEGLAQVVIEGLALFQEKYAELDKNPEYVLKVIKEGADKARNLAESKMKEVKEKMGLV
ncbi:MAG: tryptophan--tRNA ligase [Candidatus Portnoybacteria bacterium]|nr:tryptophan--tRNA ligase [Candidatus Portnoybacteria bacterium]